MSELLCERCGQQPASHADWCSEPEPEPQDAIGHVTWHVRSQGYIDIDRHAALDEWREDVVEPVIEALRQHGWTVTPPPEKGN